jgi:16S rRNA (cytosine1402-N4)-methyltransferase
MMHRPKMAHIPVLLQEVVEWLAIRPEGIYVDATVGGGGYSRTILERLSTGRLIGIDRDPYAINAARESLSNFADRLTLAQGNFCDIASLLAGVGLSKVDGIVADIGLSQMQLDSAERGFSFRAEGPLDMRMDPSQRLTAEEIVNHFDERELADVIYEYGEERRSHRIARAIVRARPIRTTIQLAELIEACLWGRRVVSSRQDKAGTPRKDAPRAIKTRIHPATQTFQALRIAVNSELESLVKFLENAPDTLNNGGRLVIVSFHSLEDRIVKRSMQRWDREDLMRNLTPHVIRPSTAEVDTNPRSRSAKLRAAERLAPNN